MKRLLLLLAIFAPAILGAASGGRVFEGFGWLKEGESPYGELPVRAARIAKWLCDQWQGPNAAILAE